MSYDAFLKMGNSYTNTRSHISINTKLRRFQGMFGVGPLICSSVWEQCKDKTPQGSKPCHLLWALNFLKEYTSEHSRKAIFDADEKTIRKWSWIFVKLLSDLDVVDWEKRFVGSSSNQTSFCSLDGVDFKISEPQPFDTKWYSHKFRAAGLRYEIGLNVKTGDIVWKNGGYPCGAYSDLRLARQSYVHSVRRGEKTIADRGYRDSRFFILPDNKNKSLHNNIMSRHETVNKRIRQFKILKDVYRHPLKKHPMVFHAVLNLTQIKIEQGEPLYAIKAFK